MSKAVLVIDMPESCSKCDLEVYGANKCMCLMVEHEERTREFDTNPPRPNWCPLKPLPDKKTNLKAFPSSLNDASWNAGYNHCINDILEGINEQ